MSPAPKATKAKAGKPASKPAAKTKAPAKVAKAAPATPKKAAAGKAAAKVKPSATAKEISAAVALPVTEVAPILMTPEEQALAAMYGDEMAAPATAHAEFRDRHTADEDRPMSPEISAREERNKQWAQRRDEGRDRGGRGRRSRFRDRDGRDGQREGGGARPGGAANPQQARPQQGGGTPNVQQPRQAVPPHVQQARLPQPPPAAHSVGMVDGTGDDATPVGNRIGTQLGDGAALVFAELRNAQPMPVRQLAGMMRKRGLMTGDPELTWPNLKGALLADERSYRAAGLRPGVDIAITFTGLRPGEKLFEELFHGNEPPMPTPYSGLLLARPRSADAAIVRRAISEIATACRAGQTQRALAQLARVVPEFAPAEIERRSTA